MGDTVRQVVFLVVDNDEQDARRIIATLTPHLLEQGMRIAEARFVTSKAAGCKKLERELGYDIVFLDIKGVDDDFSAIGELRAVNPYIPIVMMSNQGEPEYILKYVDHGARTFIRKLEDETPGNQASNSQSLRKRLDFQERWQRLRNIAQTLKRVVEEYHPIKALLLRKIESGGTVTRRERATREVLNQLAYMKVMMAS